MQLPEAQQQVFRAYFGTAACPLPAALRSPAVSDRSPHRIGLSREVCREPVRIRCLPPRDRRIRTEARNTPVQSVPAYPASAGSDSAGSGSAGSDSAGSDSAESGSPESGSPESGSAESDSAESGSAESGSAESAPRKSDFAGSGPPRSDSRNPCFVRLRM